MIDKTSIKNTHGHFLKRAASFLANYRRLIQLAGLLALLFSALYFYRQYETKLQTLTAEKIEDAKMITSFVQNEVARVIRSGRLQYAEEAFKKLRDMAQEKGVDVNIHRPDGREAFSDMQVAELALSLVLDQKEYGAKDISEIPISEVISNIQEILKRDRPKVSESLFEDPDQAHDEDYFDEALINGASEDTSHPDRVEKFIKIDREECGYECHLGENAVIKMVIDKKKIENALASEMEWGMAKVSSFIVGLLLLVWLYGKFDEINRREREQEREKHLNDLENANEKLLNLTSELSAKNKEISKYGNEMEHLAEERSKQLVHADRMVTIGTLSAGVAHEIGNPMTFIGSNLQILERLWDRTIKACLEKAKNENGDKNLSFALNEMPEMIKAMRDGVKRISTIVRNLCDFSRVEETAFEEASIRECINNAVTFCRFDTSMKHSVDVQVNVAEDTPNIMVSKSEIEQVLINLFTNALHAMEEIKDDKKPTLKVSAVCADDEVVIEISDNGCGVDEKHLKNIFSPFFTTKEVGKGTGLGLSICFGIVEKHRGTIKAASKVGEGTTFTITLPLDPVKKERREGDKKTKGGIRKEDKSV